MLRDLFLLYIYFIFHRSGYFQYQDKNTGTLVFHLVIFLLLLY